MKKRLYLLALTALFYGQVFAQETLFKRTEEFCDITIIEKTLSEKVHIAVDYGQERQREFEKLKDASGNPLTFNSPIDALHYMLEQGWELVDTYQDHDQKYDNKHYLLKRKRSI